MSDGHVGLQPGEFVADAEVGQELGSGAGISIFRATRDDGTEATVIGPSPGVSQATCDRFISSASELTSRITTAIDNVAIPSVIDPLAFAVVVDHAATVAIPIEADGHVGAMWVCQPFLMRPDHTATRACVGDSVFELKRVPLPHGGRYRLRRVITLKYAQDAVF